MNPKFLIALALSPAAQAVWALALDGDSVRAELAARDESANLTARTVCDNGQPSKDGDDTLHINLYSDSGCCDQFEDSDLTTLGLCHVAFGAFSSVRQAVGQDLFGKNIRLFAYTSLDCTGTAGVISLSNDDICDTFGNEMKSFKLDTHA